MIAAMTRMSMETVREWLLWGFFGCVVLVGAFVVVVAATKMANHERTGPSGQCRTAWELRNEISGLPPPNSAVEAVARKNILNRAKSCDETPRMIFIG